MTDVFSDNQTFESAEVTDATAGSETSAESQRGTGFSEVHCPLTW